MSTETLHGKQAEFERAVTHLQETLKGDIPRKKDFLKYDFPDSWFSNGSSGEHGKLHTGRTVLISILLSRMLKSMGTTVDEDAIAEALRVHDILRNDTPEDPGHGKKAAMWLRDNHTGIYPSNFWKTIQLIQLHDVSRKDISEYLLFPDLMVVREADMVDRVRFKNSPIDPKYKIDPSRFHFSFTKELLLPIAQELYDRTKNMPESFESVGVQAVQMGILRNE